VRRKLLLADDSLTIQRVIELMFSGENVDVVAVSDGEQAIARIPAERPDIVLADIGMPKRSGYDVSAFVKERPDLAHIPVLLLAGAFEPVDDARAKQVKCDGVLVKPFGPQQVIARVRELLDRMSPATRVDSVPPVPDAPVEPFHFGSSEPSPEPVEASVDDYFDRLDAAFATLGGAQTNQSPLPAPDSDEPFSGRDVPTIDDVLAGASLRPTPGTPPPFGRVSPPVLEPADTSPTLAPVPASSTLSPGGDRNLIAEAFSRLLAVEQGEADPRTVVIAAPAAPVAVTDELVEQITRRVIERLAPATARDLVADVVSEVAERLVREEIARIRGPRAKA
jgi:CheY-like chemotaxis protein